MATPSPQPLKSKPPQAAPKEIPIKPVYTATVTSTGGRHGRAKSSDGALNVELMPPSPTVQNPKRTNPEQLFAAGYSACFAGAMEYVAKQRGEDPGLITIIANVALGPNDAGEFVIAVDMDITAANLDQQAAETLVAEGHKACPYSKATRGNIDVKLTAHGGK